jgi:hypothetical protein
LICASSPFTKEKLFLAGIYAASVARAETIRE